MKGYKAFNKDWKCRDFQYEIGKTYELPEGQKLEICKSGFHFCKNPIDVFGYYPMNDSTLIAEIEAIGDIVQEGTKYCTNKIKIVSEFTRDDLQALIRDGNYNSGSYNSGVCNSGNCNSGDYNSGDHNSGHYNSGYFNSGRYNSGDYNSGHCNSGNYNSGIYNSGDHNSGHHNSGYFNSGRYNSGKFNSGDYNSGRFNSGDYNSVRYNSGSYNSGNYNSGDFNSGDYNSGSCNSGDFNSGIYNSGSCNSGMFNTDEPYMRIFNKSTNIRFTEFLSKIDYNYFEFLRRIHTKELLAEDEKRIRDLPNFDAEIFKEITGIDLTEGDQNCEEGCHV